ELSQFGDVVSATSFPSLLDAGMMLTLVSPDTVVTAVTEYNSSFYGDAEKAKGGWSLERIDANNLSDNGNWMVSNDANGGTPCRENSVTESKPDNIPPYVVTVEMTGDNSILLIFNEFIPFSLLQQANSFTVKNLGTPIKSTPTHIEFANQTELIFDKPFEIGVVYELSISLEIKDIHRNEYVNEPIIFGKMHKPQQNDLVINEILFNPHSGAQDFVEIYNKSDKIFDIADLAIASRNRTTGNLQQIHKISDYHRYIYPEEYFVLTVDSVLEQFYYAENPENIIIMNAFPVYPNDNGTCVLLVSEAEIVDEFSYSEKMHNVFISNKQGVSLERVDYNRPAAESTNWQSAAQTAGFATPTYKNSAYFLSENTDNDAFNLSSTTFSPDGDGYEDVLYIDYKMPEANYVASIRVYNIRGNFVKEICRNVTLGVEGRLEWNGSQANNSRSPVGPYIIFIEAFNQNGSVLKYKKICVLAEK
ncbi:MAG: lamin tail domain-containing protein, partial [Prevotellaceae bacterium]|nr:lamin tail domain-containing protein [Prevotellaceae bacterium]